MTIISLIAAIDENNGLGKSNGLLCHLPADLKHFKELTMGKPVIMGRKTYISIGKALPGRLNIVLSNQLSSLNDATVVSSMEQALKLTNGVPEVMIIGGAKVFEDALPFAVRIYLTIIHHQFEADVYFPFFSKTEWQCQEPTYRPSDEKNQFNLTFCQYNRINAPS